MLQKGGADVVVVVTDSVVAVALVKAEVVMSFGVSVDVDISGKSSVSEVSAVEIVLTAASLVVGDAELVDFVHSS